MAERTDDELWLAGLFAATFAPVMFIGPFGGVLVDRFDRKRVLLGTYCWIVAIALLQVVLVLTDAITPVGLLITGAGVGVGLALLGPASGAVTANTVPVYDLPSAISLGSMASNLSRILGPAIAAPLVAANLFEVTWGLYAAAGVLALFVISGVRLLPYERDIDDTPVLQRIASGLRHARDRQPAGQVLGLTAMVSILAVSHVTVMPNFVEKSLSRPAGDFVWLGVATGAGSLVGAAVIGSITGAATLRRSAGLLVPYAVAIIVFSQITSFVLAIVLQILIGFFYFAGMTSSQILLQQVVGESHRGRVMSLFQITWAGLVPVGALFIGLLAGDAGLGLGPARAIAVGGIGSLVSVLYVFTTARRYERVLPSSSGGV